MRGAVKEKKKGIHSARFLNWLTECAKKISKVKKPTFRIAKISTQSVGSFHQRSFGPAMFSPELRSHRFHFNRLLQHRIISMPLDKIGSTHERAVFAAGPVIVPQIEIDEINRLRKRGASEQSCFAHTIKYFVSAAHLLIGCFENLFGL